MGKVQHYLKNGVATLAVKQGDRLVPEKDIKRANEIKDFCLNCTKPKCKGECKEIREFLKQGARY